MVVFTAMWASAACPELDVRLDKVQQHLEDVFLERTSAGLLLAETTLSCGRPAKPAQLGRYWMLEGVYATVAGEPTRAQDAFHALARVHPQSWEPIWGGEVTGAYERATAAPPTGFGSIQLEPEAGGNRVYIDGSPVEELERTPIGLHALQLTDPEDEVRFGKMIYLSEGQRMVVETGVPPAPLPAERAPGYRTNRRIRRPGWLVVAGTSLALGAGLAIEASLQNERIRSATSPSDFRKAVRGQYLLGIGAYTSLGVTAGATVLWARK